MLGTSSLNKIGATHWPRIGIQPFCNWSTNIQHVLFPGPWDGNRIVGDQSFFGFSSAGSDPAGESLRRLEQMLRPVLRADGVGTLERLNKVRGLFLL